MGASLKRMNQLSDEIKVLATANEQFEKRNVELEAKVEAANKLLDSEWMPFQVQQRLKEVLQSPRSDEQKLICDKTREPPCHLEPSPELCAKCELNNCEKEL